MNMLPSLGITENTGVVIAEKMHKKRYLFGHISNGGGIIQLSHGKAIKIIAANDEFVTMQLIDYGIGQPIKSQSWQKSKKVLVKPAKKEPELPGASKIVGVEDI